MENLFIEKTNKSPEVDFNTNGHLSIWGRLFLLPEPAVFMDKLHNWIDIYVVNPAPTTKFSIGIGHTGRKCWRRFLDIAKKLASIQDQEHSVIIAWHYEDWDTDLQQGLEYELQILKVEFALVPVSDIE